MSRNIETRITHQMNYKCAKADVPGYWFYDTDWITREIALGSFFLGFKIFLSGPKSTDFLKKYPGFEIFNLTDSLPSRCVLKTLLNIDDGVFCENSYTLQTHHMKQHGK